MGQVGLLEVLWCTDTLPRLDCLLHITDMIIR